MLLKSKPLVYSFLEMLTTKYVILLISDVLRGRLKQTVEETCEAEKNIILKSSFFCYLVQSLTLFILVVGSPVHQCRSRVCVAQGGHPTDWLKKAVSHCPEILVLFFCFVVVVL